MPQSPHRPDRFPRASSREADRLRFRGRLPGPGLVRLLAPGLAALLVGCASGSSGGISDEGVPVEEMVVESQGRSTVGMEDVRIWQDRTAVHAAVPASPEEVLQVLPAVYRSLEIPVAALDSDEGLVGNPDWRPRRIAGERLTEHFRCGSGNSLTSHGGSYAYRVSVQTRVRGEGEGRAVLETRADATARPRSVTGTEIQCTSRQRLERIINGAVVGALEKAGSLR